MKNKSPEYICNNCYNNKNNNETIEKFSISPLTALCETCNKNQTSFYIYDEFDNLTPCCKKEIKLQIFPDYCSSGIWCLNCGCMLNNIANIPEGLINLCGIWNDLWDDQINHKEYNNDDYFVNIYMSTGKYLCELINQYCYCEFKYSEENLKNDLISQRSRL